MGDMMKTIEGVGCYPLVGNGGIVVSNSKKLELNNAMGVVTKNMKDKEDRIYLIIFDNPINLDLKTILENYIKN